MQTNYAMYICKFAYYLQHNKLTRIKRKHKNENQFINISAEIQRFETNILKPTHTHKQIRTQTHINTDGIRRVRERERRVDAHQVPTRLQT